MILYNGGLSGRILSVEHGTIRDGPGWRSIVYFMGCNFRCLWCASPHTIDPRASLLLYPDFEKHAECIASTCPLRAISIVEGISSTDRTVCVDCEAFDCARLCVDGSRIAAGISITVQDIVDRILPYRRFHTSYGVTISGGEPSLQWGFFIECLLAFKSHGLHTAVETNGSNPKLPQAFDLIDLPIIDLKHFNSGKHEQLTGCGNETVLNNIEAACTDDKDIWVRIPLVPGLNDGANITESAEFLVSLDHAKLKVEVLGYHRLGEHHWKALGFDYACAGIEPPSEQSVEEARSVFRRHGIEVIIT